MYRHNKATLKLDISYPDHSHIIGKGGRQIQSVMDLTGCHIHFPDCNRTSTMEKSNQVTIAGHAVQAERARQLVRRYLPLTISFVLEMSGNSAIRMDAANPSLQMIQHRHGVTISFKYMNRHGYENSFATVFIKGSRLHFDQLRAAVIATWDFLVERKYPASSATFCITIDIAAQHHSYVSGRNSNNVKSIYHQTGALISFPEIPFDPSIPPVKRSTVHIRGKGVDRIFFAWQELLGYLPLVLAFDLKEDQELDQKLITELMAPQMISIMIRPKPRNASKTIVIKSNEKYSRLLFEARRRILNLDDSEVPNECISNELQYSMALAPSIESPIPMIAAKHCLPPPPGLTNLSTCCAIPNEKELFQRLCDFIMLQSQQSIGLSPFTPNSPSMYEFIEKQLRLDSPNKPKMLTPKASRPLQEINYEQESPSKKQKHVWSTGRPKTPVWSERNFELGNSLPDHLFRKQLLDSQVAKEPEISALNSSSFWKFDMENIKKIMAKFENEHENI